ncbi:Core-capsid bridging protein [Actinidia chinensis var. chinensis]|uniref:Core-capsid bridging protein n=1 Tax=Actinidia chinensis var. chinensis TaxID=1590841 RepID=A0A2R6P6K7_ACTCC|nr:Core-capsid bridging protein [Actinidia chinensis var. chinensis]
MSPAAGPMSPSDRVPTAPMMIPATSQPAPPAMMSEAFAKDAIIAWFRGEFAAANAIIDALCGHLVQVEGARGGMMEYESVFAAIHRRRLNWIPILQMQKFFSIADVSLELRQVAEKKMKNREEREDVKESEEIQVVVNEKEKSPEISEEESTERNENGGGEVVDEQTDDSPESEITDTGSQEVQPTFENVDLCSNHEDFESRRALIKMTKGFVAKEHVKGHMVNVVRGLKLYEDIFTDSELSKLNDFVNELRVAGQNGELSGETFMLYNQKKKGNKRELIQLGASIFGHIKGEATSEHEDSHIEPIPTLLQCFIDHLVQWNLISENRKPNSCIINFFDEGEFSQPFLKPPHVDQPISTLLLSESTMAFGRTLVSDRDGNYKGPLMLSLKEGSLLVMRGNSSDMARHVMCPSPNKRVSITFFKVWLDTNQNNSPTVPQPLTLWQPGVPSPYSIPNGTLNGYDTIDVIPEWGVLHAPVITLAPMRPMVMSPRRIPNGGTGVFLPWGVGSRKPAKHLPPRAQKRRLLTLPASVERHIAEPTSNPDMSPKGKMV